VLAECNATSASVCLRTSLTSERMSEVRAIEPAGIVMRSRGPCRFTDWIARARY